MENVMTIAWRIYRKRFDAGKFSKKFFVIALKSAWMTIRADLPKLAALDAQVAATKLW